MSTDKAHRPAIRPHPFNPDVEQDARNTGYSETVARVLGPRIAEPEDLSYLNLGLSSESPLSATRYTDQSRSSTCHPLSFAHLACPQSHAFSPPCSYLCGVG